MSLHVAHWPEGVPGIPVDPDDAEDWIASWMGDPIALERVPIALAFAAAQAIRDRFPQLVGPAYRAGTCFSPRWLAELGDMDAGALTGLSGQLLACALNGDSATVEALVLAALNGNSVTFWAAVASLLTWAQT